MHKALDSVRPCDVENPEDFYRYYRSGIVGLIEGEEVIPCMISNSDGANMRLTPYSPSPKPDRVLSFRDLRRQVTFAVPQLGMVNVGPTAVFTHTTARRHAEKGYRPNLIGISNFNLWELRNSSIGNLSANHADLLWALYNKYYYHPEEAITKLVDGERVGCALSLNTALISSQNCPNPLIAYRREIIGYLTGNGEGKIQRRYAGALPIIRRELKRGIEVI